MERPELSITYLPIDELVPYAGNAKRHPPEQIEQIVASMGEFGDCDPVGIWRDGSQSRDARPRHGALPQRGETICGALAEGSVRLIRRRNDGGGAEVCELS